jgi:hypothetical protein
VTTVGDREKVRRLLGLSEVDFEAFRLAHAVPTKAEFMRILGLIIEEQTRLVELNRKILAELPPRRPGLVPEDGK